MECAELAPIRLERWSMETGFLAPFTHSELLLLVKGWGAGSVEIGPGMDGKGTMLSCALPGGSMVPELKLRGRLLS